MNVKYLTKQVMHRMMSQLFKPEDGDRVVWFITRNPKDSEICAVAACGTAKEVSDFIENLERKAIQQSREMDPAEWKDVNAISPGT